MGRGGYVVIVNATPRRLRRTHSASHQMVKWNASFAEHIEPGSTLNAYVEFKEGQYVDEQDDSAAVHYTVDGADCSFRVAAAWRQLRVDWDTVAHDTRFVRQPPIDGPIGWIDSGSNVVLLAEAEGVCFSCAPTMCAAPATMYQRWMGTYAAVLRDTSLGNLCIPSAHGAATRELADACAATQRTTLREQLIAGVRCIDLRVAVVGYRWMLVHGAAATPYSLGAALDEVVEFARQHPTEAIILDFCSFTEPEDGPFDFGVLEGAVAAVLHSVLYPCHDPMSLPTLGAVQDTGGRNVLVFWSRPRATEQAWWGAMERVWWFNVTDEDSLRERTLLELAEPRCNRTDTLRNVCVVLATTAGQRAQSVDHVTQWLRPGTCAAANAQVVSCDFVVQSNIVPCLVAQSVLNAISHVPAATSGAADALSCSLSSLSASVSQCAAPPDAARDGLAVLPPKSVRPGATVSDLMQRACLSSTELHELFIALGAAADGTISRDAFKAAYRSCEFFGLEPSAQQLDALFCKYDGFGDGRMGYDEYALLMAHRIAQ